jgi:hypothetical protein
LAHHIRDSGSTNLGDGQVTRDESESTHTNGEEEAGEGTASDSKTRELHITRKQILVHALLKRHAAT